MSTFTTKDGLELNFNPAATLELETRPNHWCTTDVYFFRSWGGNRRINGKEYYGPVYFLGSNTISEIVTEIVKQ